MPQSLAKIYVHAIFSTKHREPLLAEEWREELFSVLGAISNQIGCQSYVVGGIQDHVHILFRLGRTIALADAISRVKSQSSAWINQTQKLPSEFRWQAGYGAFSVSQLNLVAVHEYILRQAEHHAKQSFQDEFRAWLKRYEIEWDERYVWD